MRCTLILPAILFLLVHTVSCREDDRSSFGEPCAPGVCGDGLTCYSGYCEEKCVDDSDCQTIEDWKHECHAGRCQIVCNAQYACPQTLDTPLECIIQWCAAVKSD
ncbi:hypothetical protein OV079_02455 [Nannocystis pusilla]|uniref:Uncharacterized protein n=1 Tax=Nannocystis pusilla TaxID=889268 RepID=A0A9X3EI37_9BACT|nr:hypothetical protein [Nannocystis pusilla]MCY1004447.1 hypothetical protein [Nannocystis pusilla]